MVQLGGSLFSSLYTCEIILVQKHQLYCQVLLKAKRRGEGSASCVFSFFPEKQKPSQKYQQIISLFGMVLHGCFLAIRELGKQVQVFFTIQTLILATQTTHFSKIPDWIWVVGDYLCSAVSPSWQRQERVKQLEISVGLQCYVRQRRPCVRCFCERLIKMKMEKYVIVLDSMRLLVTLTSTGSK